MANPDAAPLTRTITIPVAAVGTAGNSLTSVAGVVAEDGTITAATYIPAAAITGANTNTRKVSVVNKKGDNSGTAEPAALQFNSGVNAGANQVRALTLSATAADLQVSAGDVLVVTSAAVGTGITDPGGLIRVTLARR